MAEPVVCRQRLCVGTEVKHRVDAGDVDYTPQNLVGLVVGERYLLAAAKYDNCNISVEKFEQDLCNRETGVLGSVAGHQIAKVDYVHILIWFGESVEETAHLVGIVGERGVVRYADNAERRVFERREVAFLNIDRRGRSNGRIEITVTHLGTCSTNWLKICT